MRRAVVIIIVVVIVLLYITPSTTPFSPYNSGPDGLSKFAELCRFSDDASVILLAPGASFLNISASTSRIIDVFVNFGDFRIPVAYARGRELAAPNATPLIGPGSVVVYTSPASFADTRRGPFALGLVVTYGNKTYKIYHAALFTNLALRWNSQFASELCREPVRLVINGGDLSHMFHLFLEEYFTWLGPLALAGIGLYLLFNKGAWPHQRAS